MRKLLTGLSLGYAGRRCRRPFKQLGRLGVRSFRNHRRHRCEDGPCPDYGMALSAACLGRNMGLSADFAVLLNKTGTEGDIGEHTSYPGPVVSGVSLSTPEGIHGVVPRETDAGVRRHIQYCLGRGCVYLVQSRGRKTNPLNPPYQGDFLRSHSNESGELRDCFVVALLAMTCGLVFANPLPAVEAISRVLEWERLALLIRGPGRWVSETAAPHEAASPQLTPLSYREVISNAVEVPASHPSQRNAPSFPSAISLRA